MTIVMIAHRLGTIQSANNLLFLEDNNSVLSAEKGTDEYQVLLDRLMEINYKHQKDLPQIVEEEKEKKVIDQVVNEETTTKTEAYEVPEDKIITLDESIKIAKIKSSSSKNQGFLRIMSLYRPHWMSALSFFTALMNSMVMPLHGLIQAKV